MQTPELSGLLARNLANQISNWLDAGKLDADDLDRVLTPNGSSIVEASANFMEWVPLEDVEALVSVLSDQLGGGTGIVEWAEEIVDGWALESPFDLVLRQASRLVDGAGYVVSQSSEVLIRNGVWRFEGGRGHFSVRLIGLEAMSADLKTLLGALLSRLAERADCGFDDLRFDGVDGDTLCIFGEGPKIVSIDESSSDRLHRAALIA